MAFTDVGSSNLASTTYTSLGIQTAPTGTVPIHADTVYALQPPGDFEVMWTLTQPQGWTASIIAFATP
jgi:hypothetical protein